MDSYSTLSENWRGPTFNYRNTKFNQILELEINDSKKKNEPYYGKKIKNILSTIIYHIEKENLIMGLENLIHYEIRADDIYILHLKLFIVEPKLFQFFYNYIQKIHPFVWSKVFSDLRYEEVMVELQILESQQPKNSRNYIQLERVLEGGGGGIPASFGEYVLETKIPPSIEIWNVFFENKEKINTLDEFKELQKFILNTKSSHGLLFDPETETEFKYIPQNWLTHLFPYERKLVLRRCYIYTQELATYLEKICPNFISTPMYNTFIINIQKTFRNINDEVINELDLNWDHFDHLSFIGNQFKYPHVKSLNSLLKLSSRNYIYSVDIEGEDL